MTQAVEVDVSTGTLLLELSLFFVVLISWSFSLPSKMSPLVAVASTHLAYLKQISLLLPLTNIEVFGYGVLRSSDTEYWGLLVMDVFDKVMARIRRIFLIDMAYWVKPAFHNLVSEPRGSRSRIYKFALAIFALVHAGSYGSCDQEMVRYTFKGRKLIDSYIYHLHALLFDYDKKEKSDGSKEEVLSSYISFRGVVLLVLSLSIRGRLFSSGGALLWRRGVLLLMLTNRGWVNGNGSNPSGGFGKSRGGLETRGGGDVLEGPSGQLSMV
ncbi:hypothetical protein Tco_0615863 [Tanacetum coccineum]